MSYYETLLIVHPALESGRLKDIILSIEETLKNIGGDLLYIDIWGKKRLAYLIDKQKYGTYIQFQFTGQGKCTSNFGLELEHNPNILSYLTILIEQTDVIEQENDLDTQIAGQIRETQQIDEGKKNDTANIETKKNVADDDEKQENMTEKSEPNVEE